jgi:hypothetical protein
MTSEQYVIQCAKDLAHAVSHHREMEHLMFDCPKDAIDIALEKLQEALEIHHKKK